MSFIQDLLKPGGGIALIPFIRATIVLLLLMVMYVYKQLYYCVEVHRHWMVVVRGVV